MLSAILVATLLTAEPPATGAAVAPAVLPEGSTALYGVLGAPDLGVGFRQGFAPLEVEARAMFNIFQLSGLIEGGVKFGVVKQDALLIAVRGALGLNFDSGSRYFDRANFSSIFLRPRIGGVLTYRFTDLVTGIAQIDVPFAFSLSVLGQMFAPTAGIGAEIQLGGALSLLAMGELGVDLTKEPLGVTQVRPAWALRLGIGWRLF